MIGELKIAVDMAGVVMETALLAYFLYVLLGPVRSRWYETLEATKSGLQYKVVNKGGE